VTSSGTASGPGPAVDASGSPVVDPTANVLQLVEAAVQRIDDMATLRAQHTRELMERDREHAAQLRQAETSRLDAIRAVDVGAVQRAAEVQAQVANALATQVATSADAFRVALSAQLEPLQRDIADLRKTQYEQAGQKIQVVESRAQTGESRLNINTVIILIGLVITAATFFLTR
jgi:protein-tyrosine-phosphatase